MKRTAFPIVLLFSMFIVFFSCSNTPKRSRGIGWGTIEIMEEVHPWPASENSWGDKSLNIDLCPECLKRAYAALIEA